MPANYPEQMSASGLSVSTTVVYVPRLLKKGHAKPANVTTFITVEKITAFVSHVIWLFKGASHAV